MSFEAQVLLARNAANRTTHLRGRFNSTTDAFTAFSRACIQRAKVPTLLVTPCC